MDENKSIYSDDETEVRSGVFNRNLYIGILVALVVLAVLGGVGMRFMGIGLGIGESSLKADTYDKDVENFSELEIDIPMGDIEIKHGNSYHVEYKLPERTKTQVSISKGTLKIKAKNRKLNLGFGVFNSDLKNFKVVVTVPERLSKVDIITNLGDLSISEVDCDDIKIKANLGDITIDSLKADTLKASEDAGDVTVKDVEAEDFQVVNSKGEIELVGVAGDNADISESMGNIKVSDAKIDKVNANNSMGNIKLSGSFKEVKADDSMGDIELVTDDEIKDEKIKLKTSMGSIKVNGENEGASYSN